MTQINDSTKTNTSQLSFQGITLQKSFQSRCSHHKNKKAQFRNIINNSFYCYACSVQLASKGIPIQLCNSDSVEPQKIEFQKIQSFIKQQIESYNNLITSIMQMLADMQIRDLMMYNKLLDENEKKHRQNRLDLKSYEPLCKAKLLDIQKYIYQAMYNPLKSYQTSCTQKNNLSQNSSITRRTVDIQNEKKNTNSLEDTPQSLKGKIASNVVKSYNQPMGMFQKIDICQSIQAGQIQNQVSQQKTNEKEKSSKSYRYGRCSFQ